MIALAGGAARLRPHVKTHKMAEIVRLVESSGIRKHKCATIAEAEMVAAAGGTDVLLAYPLTGPNLKRFVQLVRGYRSTTFRATVDHPDAARALSAAAEGLVAPMPVLVDLEIGMGRTGIQPGEAAAELYALIDELPNLVADGLHAYDGHIHDTDLSNAAACRPIGPGEHAGAARPAAETGPARASAGGGWNADLADPCRARSPGRRMFAGNSRAIRQQLSDALSRPAIHPGGLAADAGGQPPGPRADLSSTWVTRPSPPTPSVPAHDPARLDDARPVVHSEEHMVVETAQADSIPIGTASPRDSDARLPDCRLHRRAYVIEDGQVVGQWEVTARDRVLGV